MAWFRRRRGPRGPSIDHARYRDDLAHLEQFAHSRYGVEAYLEPRTTVTETTVMLIAHDGEWTRRRVVDPHAARQLANRLAIPLYDVRLVGYPQRMRDFNERRKRSANS
ncbi:MAG TPA: hypothetical protein VJT31_40705 [Rugosimonospora sp.]|nr:hypothetical protein [Rugosimonospora sp.]